MRDVVSKSRIGSLFVLALLVLSMTSAVASNADAVRTINKGCDFTRAQEYEPHENLWIRNDTDLLNLASAEGWNGTGTAEDPIIIEGYSFFDTVMQPVRFWDTTLHWIFRNNHVSTATEWCGIWLLRTQNGIICNNTFEECHSGTYLEHVQGLIIENNTFQSNTGSGVDGDNPVSDLIIRYNEFIDMSVDGIIFKYPASNVTIVNNHIHDNAYDSIDIQFGQDITIEDNVISDQRYGIKIAGTVTGCVVKGNLIRNIRNSGMYISGDDNEITDNIFRNIGSNGIILEVDGEEYPENNVIVGNSIINCTKYGVLVEADSANNEVSSNDFFESGEPCHICDDGTDTMIQGNFFDTWSSPDANADGIVDVPYVVLGLAGNNDLTPEAAPVNAIPSDYEYVPITPTAPTELGFGQETIALIAGVGLVICLVIVVVIKKR